MCGESSHARCGVGENSEITSKNYLSLYIIPSDLATYGKDAKALLKELQSQNERMFLITFLVLNTGKTEQELENNVFQASSIAQKHISDPFLTPIPSVPWRITWNRTITTSMEF